MRLQQRPDPKPSVAEPDTGSGAFDPLDLDPGSGAFLAPGSGSGIWDIFFLILNHQGLVNNFVGKKYFTIILCEFAQTLIL
jgi:hypothetical protein